MLPYVIAGITTGSIFALAAVGLVLTYKTSGIFNLSHGALASASAFMFYFLSDQHGMPWPIAAALTVVVGGGLLGLLLELIARRLSGASLSTKLMATAGELLTIQGGLELLFPPGPNRQVRQFLPVKSFHLGSASIAEFQVIICGMGLLFVTALTLFLRYRPTGVAMRAVVENPELLDIAGIPPTRVRRQAWVIGSVMAALSGVLLAPLLALDATTMTFLVVTAFGAAAIGAFASLPLAYLGGLGIGVGEALLQKYFISSSGLAGGLSSSLPFLILFGLLMVAPRLRQPANVSFRRTNALSWVAPVRVRVVGTSLLLIGLLLVPAFAGIHLVDWTRFLAYIVLFLALGLLVRTSGQVSLGHVAFMAIGVAAFSHLAVDHHVPWLVALLIAAAIAAPIGGLLAIPAIRFPGLYLALATLGFGLALQQMFYSQSYMFGSLGFGVSVPRPQLSWLSMGSDRGYYYVVLTVAVCVAGLVLFLTGSRLGRLLKAMSDSPAGLGASGASMNVSRVLVFGLSASLAAVAGVLDAGTAGLVGSDGYQPLLSLQLFVLVVIGIGGVPWYAVLAAASQILIPVYVTAGATVGYALTCLFGVAAVGASIASPGAIGVPATVRRFADRIGLAHPQGRAKSIDAPIRRTSARTARQGSGLAIAELVVRFGGVVAADKVSLEAPLGRVTGLIGPNGAGKSTVFNACSGLVRPASGLVSLNGSDLRRSGPPSRARHGLGRTFQRMELFDSLSVSANVALGCEAGFAGWNPIDHMLARRAHREITSQRTLEALELCDLTAISGRQVGSLSTGQRRLVELARCVAGSHDVLLLDEPSSGLDRVETERFGRILKHLVAQQGLGILLVEHDMALVNDLCDYVYVIDFGVSIFQGTVAEVAASPVVRLAYLGDAELNAPAVAVSRLEEDLA